MGSPIESVAASDWAEKMRLIKTISYKEFSLWDTKRYYLKELSSKYPIVELSKFIQQENEKIKCFQYPDDDFKILGVNNQIGLFDAYIEKGKNINQPYKIVKNDYLAYNPYRVNVGSVGLKTAKQKYDLISNAYVVFSCKNSLKPEYLYKVFSTDTFNKIIKDNTSGSVRQNLSYELLEKIQIPLPPLEIQNQIVNEYNERIKLADEQEAKAKQLEQDIENYLLSELGIEIQKTEIKKGLQFVDFKSLGRWDIWSDSGIFKSLKYPILNLEKIITFGPQYGSADKAIKKVSEYRYIRITDINEDGTLNNEIVSVKQPEEQYILQNDDLLFARSGATVGKSFLYNNSCGKAVFAGYLIRFRLNRQIVMPRFIFLFTKSSAFKLWINSNQRISAQPNINGQQYLDAPFVVPPLEKQNEIVEKIEAMRNEIKELKNAAEANRAKAKENFENEIFGGV